MRLSPSARLDAWLAPAPDAQRVAWLTERDYAHRGLHDGIDGGPVLENSMPAFLAAKAGGFGIECDVQLSGDGHAMVFHDFDLDRLTGETGPVAALPRDRLVHVALNGNNGTIPELSKMLAEIGSDVPVLVEIKTRHGKVRSLCSAVRRAIEGRGRRIAVMGFDPGVSEWFRINAPHVVRGLVMTEEHDRGLPGRLRRHLALWRARPDFLAYDVRDLPSAFAAAQHARGMPVMSWTVRTEAQRATVAAHADRPIFERARIVD